MKYALIGQDIPMLFPSILTDVLFSEKEPADIALHEGNQAMRGVLRRYGDAVIRRSRLQAALDVTGDRDEALRGQVLAKPGSKTYGALSLAVQYYTQPEIVAIVPPNCFIPRPSVDSAVVKLGDVGAGRVPVRNEKLMFALIRAAFNQRRKTLANGIKNAGNLAFSREQVTEALLEMGLPATVRGETLSPEQFAQLADLLDEGE